MGCLTRVLVAIFLLNIAVSPVYAQQVPVPDDDPAEPVPEAPKSVLELSKVDEIVDLLTTSYAANLALKSALRASECSGAEPRCAPLFFAQDVVLGPWNVVKLMRILQEKPDADTATILKPRDYQTPSLAPGGVLPAEMVSLAEYALEQQVVLYEYLEAWQVTLERYGAAVGSNDESAAEAQRRALDGYSSHVSTAAAAVNAASLQFLEGLTPLMRHFASAIAVEDAEAAMVDLQENGFGPELQERFSALRVAKADSDNFLAEITAMSTEVPVDLLDGLTAVARGYDKLADLTTVPTDAAGNVRPLANAGPDQSLRTGDSGPLTLLRAGHASVVLNGAGSTDPEGAVLEYVWTGASIKASGAKPTITLPLGTHHIALTVADGKGGTDVDLVTINVSDAAAPLITGLTATPDVLSPPSRQLVSVELDVKVVDNDDPMPFCQVVSVGINEPARDAAGGATEPDVVFDGSLTLLLRAERSGARAGRVYSVTVQCTDKTNHSSLGSVFVSVPR
jgi:hypothetical protein